MSRNNYLTIFRWVYSRLQPWKKKQFWVLFMGLSLVAAFETITLGSVAFFASAVTDPNNVLSSKYVHFLRQFITADFLNSTNGIIISSGLLMCSLITIKNCFKAITNYAIVRFAGAAEAYFGNILLDGFLKLPYHWHLDQNSADLINAIQWRPYLGRAFFQPCLGIFSDALMISIMLISLFFVQPTVSFAVLIVLGTSAFFIYKVIKTKLDKIATLSKDHQLTINKETTMSIQGIKDVKICGREDLFVKKYLQKAKPLAKIFGLQKFYGESPVLILETIGFGMLFMSICIMLLKFKITTAYLTGTMALLAVTAWKILPAVSQILNALTSIRNSLPFIKTLINYISLIETNYINAEQADSKSLNFTNSIEFKDVSFSYQISGSKIIENLSFKIKKNETIGIIGTSGAGKSTLVDLLIGLLKPVKGVILIDDQALTPDNISSWLKVIGYVPQSPYIYDGTIADNIAFGVLPEKTDRALIEKCCTMASMDDFVQTFPDNIDTFIGERGVKLSGGQQQRIAIARALYRNPEVIIFDEATSSLDTKSEKAIKNTIYSFKGQQTLIIIAHRLSTIEACDQIIWIEKGMVKMIGKPEIIIQQYNKS